VSYSRLFRSLRYTPVWQLLHRLKLTLKRNALVSLASLWPRLAQRRRVPLIKARDEQPLPIWTSAIRSPVVQEAGGWRICFLNESRYFTGKIDWHREDMNAGTRLWKLNLHYFDWSDRLNDTQFMTLVRNWIDTNRPYGDRYWLDSWNSYSMSIRVVAWMGELASRRTSLPELFVRSTEESIAEQLQFLENNLELDIGGNHLVKNIKALFWGANYFHGVVSQRWALRATRLLNREMMRQILPDGFHFELSPSYHCQVFADLMDVCHVIPEGALKTSLTNRLWAMAQVVADMTHPDCKISLFNDGGLNMTHLPHELLDNFERLTGLRPKERRYAWFRNAGYHVFRTEDLLLLYDSGPVCPDGLPAHAHGDIFAFELSLAGQRLFVDAGVYEYSAGELRSRSRSTKAHNTLTLDDLDQCEFWSAFRMGRRARVKLLAASHTNEFVTIDAQHDGYKHLRGQPIHRRLMQVHTAGELTITDIVEGGQGQAARSRLMLHPKVQVEYLSDNVVRLRVGERLVLVETNHGHLSIHPTAWWPNFGVEQYTNQLVIDYGPAPGAWTFHIRTLQGQVY
jgi:uncharacterized heparinase superfamily protein